MNKISKIYSKSSIWTQMLFWVFILLLVAVLVGKYRPVREGFIQKEKFVLKEGNAIYDNFYATIYDDLVFSNIKNDFEIGEIVNITKPSQESLILDVGSGSGHHVNAFNRRGINAIGLDISPDMVAKAKKKIS